MASASFLTSSNQATNFCSLGKLISEVGAPKCWSEAKYIFEFSLKIIFLVSFYKNTQNILP